MTAPNAAKLGIYDRGLLRPGLYADITVFDPFHYNVGIRFVIVNGEIVLDKGKHVGIRPGRVLRKSQHVNPVQD